MPEPPSYAGDLFRLPEDQASHDAIEQRRGGMQLLFVRACHRGMGWRDLPVVALYLLQPRRRAGYNHAISETLQSIITAVPGVRQADSRAAAHSVALAVGA